MKKKIQEVQEYFADKIARGLYKVEKNSEHTMDIVVDRKYRFCIWIATSERHIETWSSSYNFIDLKFTDEQKKQIFKKAQRLLKKWVDTVKRDSDLAQLKALQEKYPEA